MTAAVTNNLRNTLLDLLKSDVDSSGKFYLGLSRAKPFNSPSDASTRRFQLQTRLEMQSMKRVSASSFVVPTVTWTSGSIYNTYSDNSPGQLGFYVVNSANEVFIVVDQAKNEETGASAASTVEPTSALAKTQAKTFKTTDGYHWRFLYAMSSLDRVRFRTQGFMPVKEITRPLASLTIGEEQTQRRLQDSAISGEILSLYIDSAGTNYSAPTITVVGNGDSASFLPVVNTSGQITNLVLDSDGNGRFMHGQNYDYASITVTDTTGSGAVIKPVFAPKTGTGADPVATLKSNAIMLQSEFVNTEGSTILTENDFNQIALIRGPKKFGLDSDYTNTTANVLRSLNVTASGSILPEDERFQNTAGITGKVFHHDNAANILYYFQNDSTGFGTFANTEVITGIETNSISLTINSQNNPDVDAFSGDILYINNIDQIDRSAAQTEDIRVIIQLG
jgi:hypothetical protein